MRNPLSCTIRIVKGGSERFQVNYQQFISMCKKVQSFLVSSALESRSGWLMVSVYYCTMVLSVARGCNIHPRLRGSDAIFFGPGLVANRMQQRA
jgi:hypothetical protein